MPIATGQSARHRTVDGAGLLFLRQQCGDVAGKHALEQGE